MSSPRKTPPSKPSKPSTTRARRARFEPATWRPDRLAEAMAKRGVDEKGLRGLITARRFARGYRVQVVLNTIRGWLGGSHDPLYGRTGYIPSVFEIADALDISLDWLCGRTDRGGP